MFPEWSFDDFVYGDIDWTNTNETNPCYQAGATNVVEGDPEYVDTRTSPIHEGDVEIVSETSEAPYRSGAWVVSATYNGNKLALN